MFTSKVVLGLHFQQPTASAFEHERQPVALVQHWQLDLRRQDQFHMAIVQFIDQIDEAPCPVVTAVIEPGHIAKQDGVIDPGQFDVVLSAARTTAKILEVEPDDILGRRQHGNLPAKNLHEASLLNMRVFSHHAPETL